jgi:hypothetical protein
MITRHQAINRGIMVLSSALRLNSVEFTEGKPQSRLQSAHTCLDHMSQRIIDRECGCHHSQESALRLRFSCTSLPRFRYDVRLCRDLYGERYLT